MNNTLGQTKNLLLWKKRHTSQCFAYGHEQTLGHQKYTAMYNCDNDKFRSSSIITGDDQRPET